MELDMDFASERSIAPRKAEQETIKKMAKEEQKESEVNEMVKKEEREDKSDAPISMKALRQSVMSKEV